LIYYAAEREKSQNYMDLPWLMDGKGEVKGIFKLLLELPPQGFFMYALMLK
jgi:hypothetical protein